MKDLDSHTVRAMLGVRFQIIGMRTQIINQMRGMLKTCGIILKPDFGKSQEETIQRICEESHGVLFEMLAAVLSVYQSLKRQIAVLDRLLARLRQFDLPVADDHPRCGRVDIGGLRLRHR